MAHNYHLSSMNQSEVNSDYTEFEAWFPPKYFRKKAWNSHIRRKTFMKNNVDTNNIFQSQGKYNVNEESYGINNYYSFDSHEAKTSGTSKLHKTYSHDMKPTREWAVDSTTEEQETSKKSFRKLQSQRKYTNRREDSKNETIDANQKNSDTKYTVLPIYYAAKPNMVRQQIKNYRRPSANRYYNEDSLTSNESFGFSIEEHKKETLKRKFLRHMLNREFKKEIKERIKKKSPTDFVTARTHCQAKVFDRDSESSFCSHLPSTSSGFWDFLFERWGRKYQKQEREIKNTEFQKSPTIPEAKCNQNESPKQTAVVAQTSNPTPTSMKLSPISQHTSEIRCLLHSNKTSASNMSKKYPSENSQNKSCCNKGCTCQKSQTRPQTPPKTKNKNQPLQNPQHGNQPQPYQNQPCPYHSQGNQTQPCPYQSHGNQQQPQQNQPYRNQTQPCPYQSHGNQTQPCPYQSHGNQPQPCQNQAYGNQPQPKGNLLSPKKSNLKQQQTNQPRAGIPPNKTGIHLHSSPSPQNVSPQNVSPQNPSPQNIAVSNQNQGLVNDCTCFCPPVFAESIIHTRPNTLSQQTSTSSQLPECGCQKAHHLVSKAVENKYNGEILCIHNPPCILINGCLNLPGKTCENRNPVNLYQAAHEPKFIPSKTSRNKKSNHKSQCTEKKCNVQQCSVQMCVSKKDVRVQTACYHDPPCNVVPGCAKSKQDTSAEYNCFHVPMCVKIPECLLDGTYHESQACTHNPRCKMVPMCSRKYIVLTARENVSTQVKPKMKMKCRHEPPCVLIPKCLASKVSNVMPYDSVPACEHHPECELIPACCRKPRKFMNSDQMGSFERNQYYSSGIESACLKQQECTCRCSPKKRLRSDDYLKPVSNDYLKHVSDDYLKCLYNIPSMKDAELLIYDSIDHSIQCSECERVMRSYTYVENNAM